MAFWWRRLWDSWNRGWPSEFGALLYNFVDPRELGLVAGAGGMVALEIDLVRIPDVSFVSWARIPGGAVPEEPIPKIVPDLAVEVISPSNTPKEMNEKLEEYFEKGVRLVWFVRPRQRCIDVYTSPDQFTRLTASMMLDGGDVLPGFAVTVSSLFQMPKRPPKSARKTRQGGSQEWQLNAGENPISASLLRSMSEPCPKRPLDTVS